LDYITKDTGIFFNSQNYESLVKALRTFDAKKFKAQSLQKQAESFSDDIFKSKIKAFIDSKVR